MHRDRLERAYAPPGALEPEDPDLAEFRAAAEAESRRQALRLLGLGAALSAGGALVLWRVAAYHAVTGRLVVKVAALGAGAAVTGIVLVIVAAVLALRA